MTTSVLDSDNVDRWDDDLDGLEGFLLDMMNEEKEDRERS